MVVKNAALAVDTLTQTTEVFYPETDGMPLPDAPYQLTHFVEIIYILKFFFRLRKDVAVSGDNFIYFKEGSPRANVSPDCFVLLGGNVQSIWDNNRYLVWEVGKAPDFVLEIGSPSTWRNDLGEKRDLYARLGVGEYWMFDPSGGDHYGFALRGETLVDGEYRPLDMREDADGGVSGHSAVLNLELRWREGRLRFYDPVGARWLENMEETGAARESAEVRAESERVAREVAEVQAASAESAREVAEVQAASAESAREVAEAQAASAESARQAAQLELQAAEARADRLEAELRRLRGE